LLIFFSRTIILTVLFPWFPGARTSREAIDESSPDGSFPS
jgi:hypothetical protein